MCSVYQVCLTQQCLNILSSAEFNYSHYNFLLLGMLIVVLALWRPVNPITSLISKNPINSDCVILYVPCMCLTMLHVVSHCVCGMSICCSVRYRISCLPVIMLYLSVNALNVCVFVRWLKIFLVIA